ncbi:hypothetical protein EJ110_NYTH52962 [Nymphaea thermarum]|nr:hypothetical protein EJ110_NYTH52962 [Nymphaea thermarum]
MGKSTSSLLLHSKLFFLFSLLSLSFTLFLLFNPSSLPRRCIPVRFLPSDLIQHPLFFYPTSYGEHKYAIPTVRSSCTISVPFKNYMVVFREFQDSMRNSTLSEEKRRLRYLSENRSTFAGNFSTKERRSFFSFNEEQSEIPCGFMKDFMLSNSDRMAMENCRGLVIVSAIFNNHDKIRQPKGLGTKTLRTACFFMFVDDKTIEGLKVHNIMLNKTGETKIGVWRIVKVLQELPYQNPAMNGVIPKHLVHRLFPNAHYSIWVDAKIQLTADPLLLLHSLLISKDADMAISNHPFNIHTMEEAMATSRWKKWGDIQSLREQMEAYCENGLQPWSRKKLPYTTVEVFEQIAMEYRHNIQKGEGASYAVKSKMASTKDIDGSKCEKYLGEMWADSHD